MALQTLLETLATIRVAPLEYLTSRRLGSLSTFLSGRDLALTSYGLGGWSDLPIEKLIEEQYGIETMPWRNWIDIVQYAEPDEWAAFDKFLALAAGWKEPAGQRPSIHKAGYQLGELLERIAQRPEMYLGEPTVMGLADLVSGYLTTAVALNADVDPDVAIFRVLCARIESAAGNRAWFKVLRFNVSSNQEAINEFIEQWRLAKTQP